jgi:hypothetical protein
MLKPLKIILFLLLAPFYLVMALIMNTTFSWWQKLID